MDRGDSGVNVRGSRVCCRAGAGISDAGRFARSPRFAGSTWFTGNSRNTANTANPGKSRIRFAGKAVKAWNTRKAVEARYAGQAVNARFAGEAVNAKFTGCAKQPRFGGKLTDSGDARYSGFHRLVAYFLKGWLCHPFDMLSNNRRRH
jgi:hypothetical protein